MRSIRFRVVLPLTLGFLALALFAWDYENERVVASMGMGWDTGPPIWPYRAVPLFSYAVNTPAYEISRPILKLLDLRTSSLQYAVWFSAIMALWWWIGTSIDFGLLDRRSYSHPKLVAGILFAGAVFLLSLAAHVGLDEYRLFQQYWPGHPPIYAILPSAGRWPNTLVFFSCWCICSFGVPPYPSRAASLGLQSIRLSSVLVLRRSPLSQRHRNFSSRPRSEPTG